MPVPKIETFEYDISDELKNKQATIVDIASMDGTIETKKDSPKKTSLSKIILIILFIILTLSLILLLTLKLTTPKQITPLSQVNPISSIPQINLENLLPITNANIGRFISSVSKVDNGYAIKLLDFSSVYAYILQNESSFGKELENIFNIEESEPLKEFKDLTISNQDMRVLSTRKGKVIYSFIGNSGLAISTSTEGILTIRSVILSK